MNTTPVTATTHTTFCRICEALCGLEVTVEADKITDIRPDHEHVTTGGFACAKGLKQHHMYDSPDRLRYPLKRVGEEYVRISWDQALQEIGAKVRELRSRTPDSIAMYVGTAAGFGVLHPVFAQGFMTGIGSKNMFSSASQDCSNKFAVSRMMYGFPFTLPFPDVRHTECLIVVGANPAISKWSFLQVPNPIRHLKDIEKRGGKLFVVDPRRTETARVAGEHVFIRPDTDVFFYLSFLNEWLATGAVDHALIGRHMKGFDTVAELARPWTPEKTETVTGIPASKLREMVAAYRAAKGAALYCSTGVNMGSNGSLAFWIQEVINAVSGNLDRQGGTLVGRGVIDFPKFGAKNGILMRNDRSRIGDFGSVNDAFPGGLLADEILTPGDGQIRALFVTGGNPLITMANAGRLREAFADLELLVALDILPGETASMAHYMLPCTSPMQRPDLPFIFPLMLGLQSRPYLQATQRVIPPEAEQRDEATIYLELARASGVHLFGSAIGQRFFEAIRNWASRGSRSRGEQPSLPQESLLSGLLMLTGQKRFRRLLRHPHGELRHPHRENDFLGKRIYTEDGLLDLAPPVLVAAAEKRLEVAFSQELQQSQVLKLITRRAVTTHNSWTHNYEEFVAGGRHTNYLYMHPEDAARRGIVEGGLADVASETGKVRVPVRFLDDIMAGTVALPHGWGHQHTRLSVASRTSGVNVNLLAADGPDRIERVSGMAQLTGIPVEVSPAAGPQQPTWSGMEPA